MKASGNGRFSTINIDVSAKKQMKRGILMSNTSRRGIRELGTSGIDDLNYNADLIDTAIDRWGAATWNDSVLQITSEVPSQELYEGLSVSFMLSATNPENPTVTLDGLVGQSLLSSTGGNLAGGALTAGQVYTVTYDGTAFRISNVAHASTADNATNADNATHADSADTATTATNADNATHATSADTATTATNADSATHATSADSATTATNADNATHANTADTATTATSADNATHATSADSATTATSADSAANADEATHAKTADSATTATTADSATSADNATHADSADNATNANIAANYTADGGIAAEFASIANSGNIIKRSMVYKAPGTYSFQVPSGIVKNSSGTNEIYITACGGGGGGGLYDSSSNSTAGGTGGTTSFDSLLSLIGGGGGGNGAGAGAGAGGSGSGAIILGSMASMPSFTYYMGGAGGSGFSTGAPASSTGSTAPKGALGAGGGGASFYGTGSAYCGYGGGAGDYVLQYPLNVTAGQSYTVTVGAGGSAGSHGGQGGNGYMLIEWYENI